jgi:hypothetical protein
MPAAAIPAWALITSAVAPAAAQAATGIYGARKQGQANSKALTFEQQQAQVAAQNAEADRHANYDQWAARQQRLNAVTGAVGWGTQAIPRYTPGVMPQFTPRSVGDYLLGPAQINGQNPTQPRPATPHPYRVGDVNSYL